jgi:S-adenosylmethionine decarboxylase
MCTVRITSPQANSMNVGCEWLIDAEGCSVESLCDLATIRGLCDEIVAELSLQVVDEPKWHQFASPGGVTGLYLLTESHLACHTYPERGIATFNLYCCTPRKEWTWETRLRQVLKSSRVTVRVFERGAFVTTMNPQATRIRPESRKLISSDEVSSR